MECCCHACSAGNDIVYPALDELLRVDTDARSELTRLDEQEPELIQKHRDLEVQRSPPRG